ncbi:hypothetical protein Slin15195_G040970 [Septoria linicola]|uniref:Uncharacterized protein n=1 Tax=Septoria linicola TaxID=215465 RepID=A0A9Q9EIX1_9PEZI|nr:hypothetical protein Slin14017_G044500 [Septoria linicola]USW50778.1 hypothetical protein Slin15195_G040970 [Septoria linicola]
MPLTEHKLTTFYYSTSTPNPNNAVSATKASAKSSKSALQSNTSNPATESAGAGYTLPVATAQHALLDTDNTALKHEDPPFEIWIRALLATIGSLTRSLRIGFRRG